jgi:hypothetical protein
LFTLPAITALHSILPARITGQPPRAVAFNS